MKRKNEAHETVINCLTVATLQLMERKAFSEITVSELCKRAGVSRVSFYRNFNSIQDILATYLKKSTDDWWGEFVKKPEVDFYETFWQELLEQYKKNDKLIHLLVKNNLSYILKDHIFSCCGPTPEDNPQTAYIRAILAGAIYSLVDEWIRRGMTDIPNAINLRKLVDIYNIS